MAIFGISLQRLPMPSASAAIPILVLLVLVMMLVPLPPFLLDILFTFNIAVSIMVLILAINIKSFKDFVAFPTVLLLTTLLRLSLNVASTRVVLIEGHTGPGAAGKVIEAFGQFLIGGNFAVGIVIFIVITIINFVVITKGSGRVAEVSARFALDSMPGKQMAIDADLNAGIIKQDEARERRNDVAQEADFYGSMDGASKFVRGDAVAGIMILVINLIGGIIVGVLQYNLDFSSAFKTYAALSIGDGLVAQVPALIISTAAGILVTRVATEDTFSEQVGKQFGANSTGLAVAAVILGVLGVVPGMPHTVFIAFAIIFAVLAWLIKTKIAKKAATAAAVAATPTLREELDWKDVPVIEPLCLELPYRLITLVEKGDDSDLIKRIRAIRRKFIGDVGYLTPSVHIRDNLQLQAETYRFLLYGAEIGRGQCLPDKLLAIQPAGAEDIGGIKVTDPTFGMPAIWINRTQRDEAITKGYTVVEPAVVLATHLDHLVHKHAHELLGRQETQDLLEHFKASYPKLVEDVVPKIVTVANLQRLLQLLLEEGVPIKDLRTILEVGGEVAVKLPEPQDMLQHVRFALRRTIVQETFGDSNNYSVLGIQPEFERLIEQAIGNNSVAPDGVIEPGLARLFGEEVIRGVDSLESLNLPPVIVCSTRCRLTFSRLAKRVRPQVIVLGMGELPPTSNLSYHQVLCSQAASNSNRG
jgi:flagellar biosynthesis protein FlhA